MVVFTGLFDFALDEKNRLSIPSKMREEMEKKGEGKRLYLVPGIPETTLWMYTEPQFQKLAADLQSSLAPEANLLAFKQTLFSNAETLDIDSGGRVVIPARHIQMSGLTREVTLRGVFDHIEILSRAAFDEQKRVEQWKAFNKLQDRYRDSHLQPNGGNPAKAG